MNWILYILLLIILPLQAFSQYNLFLSSETEVSYCNPLVIEGGIEKGISSNPSEIIQLQLESSFPLELASFSSELEFLNQEGNVITFNIQNNACDYFNIFIELNPTCNDLPQQFITTAKLLDQSDTCLTTQELIFFVSYPLISVEFGEYDYNASTESLVKTVSFINNGKIAVNDFYIVTAPDRQFSTLNNEPQGTTRSGDTLFINRPLLAGQSLDLTLEYVLDDCELRTISYGLHFGCESTSCFSRVDRVDENELLSVSIAGGPTPVFVYGLCEPRSTNIKVYNNNLDINSSVNDIYNIRLQVLESSFRDDLIECFDVQSLAPNLSEIALTIDNDDLFIDLSSLLNDPDGNGGFSDLDGDGQFDDLASEDSLTVLLSSFVKLDCYDQYTGKEIERTVRIRYDNFCQQLNESASSSRQIGTLSDDTYFMTNIPTPERLQSDANNNRSISVGDTIDFTFRIRPSTAINTSCGSNIYILSLDIPENVRPLDDNTFTITDEVTEWQITPFSFTGDTLYQFELALDESKLNGFDRYSITKNFLALCVDDFTLVNTTQCDQCLEIPTHRFRSSVEKECSLNCVAPLPDKTNVSADFYVVCEEEPDLALLVDYETSEIYNLTEGFSSVNPKIKRDAFDKPSSLNNRLFFDGDTMLIRIPITINCLDELEELRVSALRDYFPDDRRLITVIEAVTYALDDPAMRCDFFNSIESNEDVLFLKLFTSAELNQCFQEGESYYIDVKAIASLDLQNGDFFDNTAQLTFSTRIRETNANTCVRNNTINRHTMHIHDVFNPNIFLPKERFAFNSSGYFLYQTKTNQFTIYDQATTSDPSETEYKFTPILKNISFEVPIGFELINSFHLLQTKPLPNDVFFNVFNISLDTLVSFTETIIVNQDSRTYTYLNPSDRYFHNRLDEGLIGSYELKSTCVPENQRVDIQISGTIEYVDYANGTLDTLLYDFNDRLQVSFIDDFYINQDDFQDLTGKDNGIFNVTIRGNSPGFEFVDTLREELETRYRFEFQSSGTTVDSIVLESEDFDALGNTITESLQTENIIIDDLIIDVRSFPQAITNFRTGDTIFSGSVYPFNFVLHTSNHPCGFDTIRYNVGLAAQFESVSCDTATITEDFFVIFSNLGFPNITFDSIPELIDVDRSNSFFFSLENIGAAPLFENDITLSNYTFENYVLWRLDDSGQRSEDITTLSQNIQDTLAIYLTESNSGALMNPGEDRESIWQFELEVFSVCPIDSFFTFSIDAISRGTCIGDQQSQTIQIPNLPYVSTDQINYDIIAVSLTTEPCADTLELLLDFNPLSPSTSPSDNTGLYLELANDLNILPDGLTFNNQPIPSIQTVSSGNNTSTIFKIALPGTLSTNDRLNIKLDGTCIDICRSEQIRAFLFNDESFVCNGQSSSIDQTIGILNESEFIWNSSVVIDSVSLEINSITIDSADIILRTSFSKQPDSPIPNPTFIDLFNDTNNNNEAESDEVIDRFLLQSSLFTDNKLTIDYFTKIPIELFCSLEMAISNDSSCSCVNAHIDISQNQSFKIENQINFCGQSVFDISLIDFPNACALNQSLDNGIQQIDELTLQVEPAIFTSPTLSIERLCGVCTLIETFEFIQSSDNSIRIEQTVTDECEPQALVLWQDDSVVENFLSIDWNQDQDLRSSTFPNPTNGLLTVLLVDQGGCEFRDSIMININAELNVEINHTQDNCVPQFPISVDLTVSGGQEPYTVQWSDNNTELSRQILEPGLYVFTVTDDDGCPFEDSIAIGNTIDFILDVKNPSCQNQTLGSIEISNTNSELLFGLELSDLSTAMTFIDLEVGNYTVYAMAENGCIDSTIVEIIPDVDQILLADTITLASSETIQLDSELTISDDAVWMWTSTDFELSCTDCPNPELTPQTSGSVILQADDELCRFSKIIFINIPINNSIYIPDAFRVTSTISNNKFRIIPNSSFDKMTLSIYDRWGNRLYNEVIDNFDSDDFGWDGFFNGELAAQGIYVYRAKIERFADETNLDVVGEFVLFH